EQRGHREEQPGEGQDVAPEVAATLKQFTCCYRISLTLLDENPQWAVVIALDQPAKTLSVGVRINVANTAAAENVLNGRLNVTPDLAAETDFPAEKMLFDAGYRSRINIPLRTGDQVIGSLNLVWRETDGYDTTQFPLLTQIAEGIALAVERSRLFDETRRRAAELEAVANISTALRLAQTVDEILPTILEMSIGITAGAEGDVFLIEPKTGDLVSRGYYPPDDSLIGRRHAPGEGITGHVAATGGLYISEDLLADPLICPLPQENERLRHTQSSISLPLHAQDRVVGVMNIGLAEKRPFSNNEIRLLTAIAEIAGSALDRALLLETLEQRVAARTRDLAEANERLQELDQLKTKFVSDVSHELRTPITNLNLYLDLLEKGDPANHARYMSILRKQTTRLIDLIEDTLSLSRLDMGKSKIKFSPVSLNDIVTQVATAHLPRVTMAGLTLATDLQTDLPLARGERNQLAQVVTNLLANAINYTPDGHIAIQTYLDEEREQICLEVADTGLGIDPDDRRHLFERFYRG
ncbi:MAG: GAF domain-containing protein, partial [Methyloligellaceae bacterium]